MLLLLFLIIILNMASQSSPEVINLLKIIKSINQDRISDAVRTLTRFSDKNYQIELNNLINRFYASQSAEEAIEKLIKKNYQLQQKIKTLELKIIEEKKRKATKYELEKQMIVKAKLTDYLLTDNLQKVLKVANQHEYKSLQVLVHDLMEYRWIKQSHPNPKMPEKHTQPTINIDFSKETKHIKKLNSDAKHYICDLNSQLASQFMNLYGHRVTQIRLSHHLFSKEVRQILYKYNLYMKQLQENFRQQISQFRDMIIDACKRRSIIAKYEKFAHTALLRLFIQSLDRQASNSTPAKGATQQVSVPSKQTVLQSSIKELVDNINAILLISKQDFLVFTIQRPSLKAIWECFHKIINDFGFAKESISSHNQILSVIASNQSSASQSLMKMNVQLKVRMPQLESITNSNFADMALRFESNLAQLLNQYDRNQKWLASFEPKVEDEKLKYVEEKQETGGMSQDRIQIEQLQQKNLLVQQIQTLKKQLDEAYKVITLEKNNSEKLRQKVKVSLIQSNFFLSPQFTEDKKEAELQQEICALRLQNERIKQALEEQRTLNSNFQQRIAQTLKKAQSLKAAELQKQKQRYERLKQDLNDAIEQIAQLNKMFQDKQLFSSKRMPRNDKNESIIDQGERKNFMSKIVQASVIFDSLDDVDDLEKIKQLQDIMKDLKQMMKTKQNEYLKTRMSIEISYNRDIQELKRQNATLGKKVKDLQIKVIANTPQNLKNSHVFPPGFIFDYADHEERLYLIDNLVSYLGTIKRTRLLFRYDHFNKTNFHRYIDGHMNIVIIIKTIYGKLIAAYSEQAFVQGATKRGFGLLLSLWARKSFQNKDQRAITYDDYYILFGNSELRLKSQQLKVFSNFGIANGYYDNKGEKVNVILGEDKEREVEIAEYEIYALDLQD